VRPVNEEEPRQGAPTAPGLSRQVATDHDIFEHPYVLKLEAQVEKWQDKYHDQVRRTEEIQMQSQEKILELQRMTTVGQSKTLADFMLQAKEWIIGQPKSIENGDVNDAATSW
jgi:hypothetical protein